MAKAVSEVGRGRESFARRAWLDAHDSLSHADRDAPLDAEDLELLATSAYMLGRDDEWLAVLERAHHAYLGAGEGLRAVRCAFWVGMSLALRGELGRATGWLGRAQRLLERVDADPRRAGPGGFGPAGRVDGGRVDTGQIPFRIESRAARIIWPVLRFVATRVLTANTPLGRKVGPELRSHGGPLLRVKSADLEAAGVERVFDSVVGVVDGLPMLEGGRVVEVSNVIWCTGFRNDFDWIRLPVVGEDGFPEQRRGVALSSPGLYFVGLVFLHSFSSMLILGAGRDAGYVAKHIASKRANGRRTELPRAAAMTP